MATEASTVRRRRPPQIVTAALLSAMAVAACVDDSAVPAGGADTSSPTTENQGRAGAMARDEATSAAAAGSAGEPAGTAATPSATGAAADDALPGMDAPSTDGDLAARVNGEAITLEEYRAQSFPAMKFYVDQGVDPSTADGQAQLLAVRRQVLDDMINQKLIDHYAAAAGITVPDSEVDASMTALMESVGGPDAFADYLTGAQTSAEQAREQERQRLIGQRVVAVAVGEVPTRTLHVHARHILCAAKAACEAARARITAGEDFAAVAKDVSEDTTSARRGGDLDWVARGMLPGRDFEDALFSLDPGQLSPVVKSEFGYHVIEVLEVDPDRPLDETQQFQLRERRFLDWVDGQRATAEVEIMVADLVEAATPTSAADR